MKTYAVLARKKGSKEPFRIIRRRAMIVGPVFDWLHSEDYEYQGVPWREHKPQ